MRLFFRFCHRSPSIAFAFSVGAVLLIRGLIALAIFAGSGSAQSLSVTGAPATLNTIRHVTSSDTATIADYTILADATSGAITETLPANPYKGELLNVKKIDSTNNQVTINGNGANVDGTATEIITTQWADVQMQFDGTNWFIL